MAKDRFEGFPGFGEPRFTQVPDVLFDQLLPDLGHAELKVLLVIMRKTFGWRKDADAISLSQLAEGTGLSRRSVQTATSSLEEGGYILIERTEAPDGGRGTNVYRLRLKTCGLPETARQSQ